MKKRNRRITSLLLTAAMAATGLVSAGLPVSAEEMNHVVDMADRELEVKANAEHAMCLAGPSFEKALMLGVPERVGGISSSALTEWSEFVYPDIVNIPVIENPKTPNLEELMSLGAEFVLFWKIDDQIELLEEVGIPAVVVQFPDELPYSDREGFLEYQKKEVNAIGQAFGGTALENAEKWCDYFDEKVEYVTSRTEKLTEDEIPKVYYARSDEGLVTFSQNSYPQYLVEMAGGNYVSKDTAVEMNSTVTIEQIMEWDPDIIFMGRMDNVEIVTENPAWSGITAVKEGAVYLCPTGIKDWDYSSENVLLMLYLAKMIHPDLFEDLDLEKEIHDYYQEFYGFDLSDENVQNILNHMGPAVQ